MTKAVIPTQPQTPCGSSSPPHYLSSRRLFESWIDVQVRQPDANRAVTPSRRGLGRLETPQIEPVLLCLIKERFLKGKCSLGYIPVEFITGLGSQLGKSPAYTGDPMCETANASWRIGMRPARASSVALRTFAHSIPKLRGHIKISLLSSLSCENE
jgi:hypothetical protein